MHNKIKELELLPDNRDIRISNELLSVLGISDFEENIYKQDSWYGYSQGSIKKSIRFCELAFAEQNQTSDDNLNGLIRELAISLSEFHAYSSKKLFNEGLWYKLAKENEHNLKVSKAAAPIMNKMTSKGYKNLQNLCNYMRKRKYMTCKH